MINEINNLIDTLLKEEVISIEKVNLINNDLSSNFEFYTGYWLDVLKSLFNTIND